MKLRRRPDWATLLDRFLREHQHDDFVYGQWDCCLFVCAAIEAMTGMDPAERFRGRYETRGQAARVIRRHTGSRTLEAIAEAVTRDLGMPEISVLQARRGDVVLTADGRGSLGLVALNGRDVVVVSESGLWRLPLSHAIRAWQVRCLNSSTS